MKHGDSPATLETHILNRTAHTCTYCLLHMTARIARIIVMKEVFCTPPSHLEISYNTHTRARAFRVCRTSQKTLVNCPKSLESGGWVCTRVQPRCVRVRTCCQDMRGQTAEIGRGGKKEREGGERELE